MKNTGVTEEADAYLTGTCYVKTLVPCQSCTKDCNLLYDELKESFCTWMMPLHHLSYDEVLQKLRKTLHR
jgi:hypothetical protein